MLEARRINVVWSAVKPTAAPTDLNCGNGTGKLGCAELGMMPYILIPVAAPVHELIIWMTPALVCSCDEVYAEHPFCYELDASVY